MKTLATNTPSSVAALDDKDPAAGGAHHVFGIQYGGPMDVCRIQYQHGPRSLDDSTPGILDDDLLAIVQERLEGFQSGPFACEENATALDAVKAARQALGLRVARRVAKGVLGLNETH